MHDQKNDLYLKMGNEKVFRNVVNGVGVVHYKKESDLVNSWFFFQGFRWLRPFRNYKVQTTLYLPGDDVVGGK